MRRLYSCRAWDMEVMSAVGSGLCGRVGDLTEVYSERPSGRPWERSRSLQPSACMRLPRYEGLRVLDREVLERPNGGIEGRTGQLAGQSFVKMLYH